MYRELSRLGGCDRRSGAIQKKTYQGGDKPRRQRERHRMNAAKGHKAIYDERRAGRKKTRGGSRTVALKWWWLVGLVVLVHLAATVFDGTGTKVPTW